MRKYALFIIPVLILIGALLFSSPEHGHKTMVNGVCLVAPESKITAEIFAPIKDINANWIAVVPYAYLDPAENMVTFNFDRQYWGETPTGSAVTIALAQEKGLSVMLKPHIWVVNQGWAGDYTPENESDWVKWEQSYEQYLLTYSRIADSMNVPLFCIGTEFRKTVVQRADFWKGLIKKIRKEYSGELTYAANWDNYENIPFWNDLDHIGIDAYFPLSTEKTPPIQELEKAWQPIKENMSKFSEKHHKPILFTEFGYESKDYATDGHWKQQKNIAAVNMQAQYNAYQAIFNTFWKEPWFSGGFLWKWFPDHQIMGGSKCTRYTPQNKLAEAAIKDHFQSY